MGEDIVRKKKRMKKKKKRKLALYNMVSEMKEYSYYLLPHLTWVFSTPLFNTAFDVIIQSMEEAKGKISRVERQAVLLG